MCCLNKALTLTLSRRERGRRARRGQALVEFAVVALLLYMLVAAVLTFGQAIYSAQSVQQAVDSIAREISRTPLPAVPDTLDPAGPNDPAFLNYVLYGNATTDTALAGVRKRVFDDNFLVLSVDPGPAGSELTFNGGHPLGDFPLATQQLFPLMIYDTVGGQSLLRFPGALFQSAQQGYTSAAGIAATGYVVRIPVVTTSSSSTTETIVGWVPPLEPIVDANGVDGFALNSTTVSGQSGVVALRVNYPYQSASMSGYQPGIDPSQPGGPPLLPIGAGGGGGGGPSGVGAPVTSDEQFGPYAGADGLGQQAALGETVRPFRRLISAQAIYRREVFQ